MMTTQPMQSCLSSQRLDQIALDQLSKSELHEIEKHVDECEYCQSQLRHVNFDSHHEEEVIAALRENTEWLSTDDVAEEAFENAGLTSALKLLGPSEDPNRLGRIGPYEVVGVIGRGGMGVVFKAYDAPLNRFVAIKMLLPHLAASGAARRRFAREAQAAAAVIDDHVTPIYNVSEWQDTPYLVTQYCPGVTLQTRLESQGPQQTKEILRIGIQTARGLAAAHAQGLVHRDIKPSNILLDGNVERAMLTDFGLARAVDDASITRTGIISGTPQYMSPEQASGRSVDERSDLFSLGSLLYAMCTGHSPFRAESSHAVTHRICNDSPRSIREINDDVPLWLEHIVMKLLAKSADDRFQSANEVAEILESCLAHAQNPSGVPLPESVARLLPSKPRRKTWLRFLAAIILSCCLFCGGVLIVLELNKGTLIIQSDLEGVPIRVKEGDKVVERFTLTQADQFIRIAAGKYVVEVDGEFDDIELSDSKITLRRGQDKSITITRKTPKADPSKLATPPPLYNALPVVSPFEDHPGPSPATDEFGQLEKDYAVAQNRYRIAVDESTNQTELQRAYRELDPRELFPSKYLDFEEKYRGSRTALNALVKVVNFAQSVGDPESKAAQGRIAAVERLIDHYLKYQGIEKAFDSFGGGPLVPDMDRFFQLVIDQNPFPKTRAAAVLAQIDSTRRMLEARERLEEVKQMLTEYQTEMSPKMQTFYKDWVAKLEKTSASELRVRANSLIDRLRDDFAYEKISRYGNGAAAANALSKAINNVIIGQTAPNLSSFDINETPFRLEDHRGKIVLILFTHGVGNDYRDMFSSLRQLAAKYRHRVEIVGIIATNNRQEVESAFEQGDLPWTVIHEPFGGPIQLEWGIDGYSKVYPVDADGILHPDIHMPYYGDGGYDTTDVAKKVDELLKKSSKK